MDAEQAEAYKERQRAEWDSSAEGLKTWRLTMEAYTRPVVDQLVGLADLQPGDRVLDVATGLGGMALDAAEAVGPEGEVHATDLSPAMIAIAKERAAETEVDNVTFEVADAETMELAEASFDAAICSFSIGFFPDRAAALGRIRAALRPGGRFATSVPGPVEEVPFMAMPMGVVMELLEVPPPPPEAPGAFSVAGEAALHQELEQGGFEDVRTETVSHAFRVDLPAEYVRLLQDVAAPLTTLLADEPDEKVEEVWRSIEEEAAEFVDEGSGKVTLPGTAAVGVGAR